MPLRVLPSLTKLWRPVLDGLLTVALIGLAGTLIWVLIRGERGTLQSPQVRPVQNRAAKAAPPLPADPVSIDGALVMGSRSARLALIEYSDVQCPYCATFVRDTLPEFDKQFLKTGKVLYAFRHFPLEQIHPMAMTAALAIECAGQQNRAWPMHDRLFEEPKAIQRSTILAGSAALGLKSEILATCMSGPAASAKVAADIASGRSLGVTGTPTFFVGRRNADGRVQLLERLAGSASMARLTASLEKWSGVNGQ